MSPEAQIDNIVNEVFEQAGLDIASDIQSTLSNSYPPASIPYESPHKRSGNLQSGVRYLVRQEGLVYLLEISSEAVYSAALEYGYPERNLAPRPFMRPAQTYWAPILIDRLQAAFGGGASSFTPAYNPFGSFGNIPTESVPLNASPAGLSSIFGIEFSG